MARPIVLSNGELHVGINKYGMVHDFYYPYVGLENHAAGKSLRHHVGVWVDGHLSWLDDHGWAFRFTTPHDALVSHITAINDRINIMIEFEDTVDAEESVFMRNIHIVNLENRIRDIRLFTHQAFVIGDARSNTDTGQYLPDHNAVLHYRGRRALVVSGLLDEQPFDQYTIGLFGIEGREGTYKDAEDGNLSCNPVEHGRVDSTLRFKMEIEGHGSKRVQYWITAGISMHDAISLHSLIHQEGVQKRIHDTVNWWHKWLEPAYKVLPKISPKYHENFKKSLMIMKSQMDKRGAVIASTDTSMLSYSRDAYAYCWPRDAAYVMWPFIRLGYTNEPYRFFEFCRRGLHPDGFLMHKYRADGAVGSSWHPYIHPDGNVAPPIQEDETALTLFMFAQFYHMHKEPALLNEFYHTMVAPMANFLATYVDEKTGLPRASYDLWEEKYLTTTYTVSLVYAALLAAAELAEDAKDPVKAVEWRSCAGDFRVVAHKYLYNKERSVFYKGLLVKNDDIVYDSTLDSSSIFGPFMYGLYSIDSEEMKTSIDTLTKVFGLDKYNTGIPRYENDGFNRVSRDISGNWWIISSLWLAQYYIEKGDQDAAEKIILWVQDHASTTGILPEQISPLDDSMVSVAPLTWSHAEFIATILDLITEKDDNDQEEYNKTNTTRS